MQFVRRADLVGAAAVASIAFLLYHATLVPGMDLGDSASFQLGAGAKLITPRMGYPLYFALADIAAAIAPHHPAYAVNVLSAICGALAAAVLTLLVAALSRSTCGGVFAGLLFTSSYTFWSQSVTAEVYALHMICVGLTLLALRAWVDKPSSRRLAMAFAVYAISFGNHLSMILLAPAIVCAIALGQPRAWRGLIDRRTVALAVAMAAMGAAQYGWNITGMLAMPDVPPVSEILQSFWFDVTKTDWRESMVLGTPAVMLTDRAAMYWFDLRQQFGVVGLLLAAAGAVWLMRQPSRDSAPIGIAFVANWLFAFTYNVGDVHVFFLPSHMLVAVAAGCGCAAMGRWSNARGGALASAAACVVALLYPAWRVYDTYPALDRSADRRAEHVLDAFTENLSPDRAVVAVDLNWQLQNGLAYFARYSRPDLQYFRTADRLLAFPFLVEANVPAGRSMYLSADSRRRVTAAFGSVYSVEPDPSIVPVPLTDLAAGLPAGTPYVLCLLTPYRDRPIDPKMPAALFSILTDRQGTPPLSGYTAIAGVKGTSPILLRSSARPFRTSIILGSKHLIVRMDAWLTYDTIRRADFGHVIADHRHALGIDRGLSFVAWPDGREPVVAYESSLYAPQPRFLLRSAVE